MHWIRERNRRRHEGNDRERRDASPRELPAAGIPDRERHPRHRHDSDRDVLETSEQQLRPGTVHRHPDGGEQRPGARRSHDRTEFDRPGRPAVAPGKRHYRARDERGDEQQRRVQRRSEFH